MTIPAKIRTIVDTELRSEVHVGSVTGGKIIETSHGFQMQFTINGRDFYLATRREPEKPRLFSAVESLSKAVIAISPYVMANIRYEHKEPFQPRKRPAKKKAK